MFQAGFARVDITPPLGSPLAGNSQYRPAEKILDPLELNCVAFSDGEHTALLITGDFLYVMEDAATRIRGMIAKRCDIPASHVFMQGLHQHTSLRIGTRPHVWGKGFDDQAYLDVLYRKYCDVASLAIRDLKDASLYLAEKETSDALSFIRRYEMKDGSYKMNPGRGNPNIVRAIGESDNTVRLIRIKREEGEDIAIVNFQCHPDVIGGKGISADWPGFVRRYTEKALPHVKCILVNGFQGDSNHINPLRDPEEDKKRVGYKHADYMGKTISDTAVSLWNKATPVEAGRVWGKVEMAYVPTNMRGIERAEECRRIRAEVAAGIREPFKDHTANVECARIADLQRELIYQNIPVCLLGLGKIVFVGLGGEPFTKYAANAREVGKGLYVITACLTGGGQGYLPTKQAYEQGGFEAQTSRFDACVEEQLKDSMEAIMNEYKNL
ncbi:MAG: hypothetical protein IJC26_07375 [Clostridia bacterium]|nr:hypothetical protein [Clostridia bacterium]